MSEVKPVVIYGIGQQAEMAHYYFTNDLQRVVVAFAIDMADASKVKMGLPVYSLSELAKCYGPDEVEVHIGIGAIALNAIREQASALVTEAGFSLTSCISPRVVMPNNVHVGASAFIDHCSQFSPFSSIGSNFSAVAARIGHHCTIGDTVTVIASVVGANVTIGNNCLIGIHASIAPHVSIGEFSIIDVGAVVKKDVPAYSVVSTAASRSRRVDARRVKVLGRSYQDYVRQT